MKKSEAKIGKYVQFCQDQGSDITVGTRLFIQNAEEKEGRKILVINDIAHKIANLLSVEVEKLGWLPFAKEIAQMKNRLQFTKWAELCPPNQRSKSRYMNLDELVTWSKKILAYIKETEAKYQKITSVENSQYLKDLLDQFGWIKFQEPMIQAISDLLLIGKIIRQKIRIEGLHSKTSEEIEKELQNLSLGKHTDPLSKSLLDFISKQTENLQKEQVVLGSTEIIESVFGKLKQLMDEDTKDGFTSYVLSIAACVGSLSLPTVQKALSTCTKKQVKTWIKENIPETIYSKRRQLFKSVLKSCKIQKKDHRGQDYAGILSENVMNL